jgi:hypothetical protein
MKDPILAEDSYTFADYFRLNADLEDVLAHFGFSYQGQHCTLPRRDFDPAHLSETRSRLEEQLPYLTLTNETARREFLIAPIVMEIVHYTHARVKVEYPLEVSPQLRGTVDYFLRTRRNVLIIEAKNADLQRGFTQLAVELVALHQWLEEDDDQEPLYGAVSMGNVWQFGFLEREARRVTQDLNLFRVPADVEDLVGTLVAILGE